MNIVHCQLYIHKVQTIIREKSDKRLEFVKLQLEEVGEVGKGAFLKNKQRQRLCQESVLRTAYL